MRTSRRAYRTASARKLYLFVISGEVVVTNQTLGKGDQARIEGESQLDVTANQDAELILLDLA